MAEREITELTAQLLDACAAGDFATYERLSDAQLTCIEPETLGSVVQGLAFHRHFFPASKPAARPVKQNTVAQPVVQMLGPDAAVIAYVRVIQGPGDKVASAEETRVWRRVGGQWKNVHFHRSSRL